MKGKILHEAEEMDDATDIRTDEGNGIRLRCPVCGHSDPAMELLQGTLHRHTCPSCGFTFVQDVKIWRALTPLREEHFQQFMIEYETIRLREGRGSAGAHYYLELPFRDVTGSNTWQWKIRARSFRFFQRRILPWIEYRYPQGLDVLDIGAGNCWLSYRMALRGHRPVSVDLLVNSRDGLGAAHHYFDFLGRRFELFQAEMDRLPFDADQFDLAIFNASFHYSEDYSRTVREVLRCLRRPGHLLIMDSPFYRREEIGRQMLEEKHFRFQSEYGFRSDSLQSREYLTPEALADLSDEFGIEWKTFKPWYGAGWALRPVKARLLRRREPAKFRILWAILGDA